MVPWGILKEHLPGGKSTRVKVHPRARIHAVRTRATLPLLLFPVTEPVVFIEEQKVQTLSIEFQMFVFERDMGEGISIEDVLELVV
jgi:hypothetical protein